VKLRGTPHHPAKRDWCVGNPATEKSPERAIFLRLPAQAGRTSYRLLRRARRRWSCFRHAFAAFGSTLASTASAFFRSVAVATVFRFAANFSTGRETLFTTVFVRFAGMCASLHAAPMECLNFAALKGAFFPPRFITHLAILLYVS